VPEGLIDHEVALNFIEVQPFHAPLKEGDAGQGKALATATAGGQLQGDSLAQLEKLAQLMDKGVLTNEEFQAQKAKLIS
jgi:Short C-terminal domain